MAFSIPTANVSLVSQALEGKLPSHLTVGIHHGRSRHRTRDWHENKKPPSIESAADRFFTGLGFLFVSLAAREFAPAGEIWWFWLLIPAFSSMGAGIGQYLKLREQRRQQQSLQLTDVDQPKLVAPTAHAPEISAPTTSELASPSSVTEHTTKHLDQSRTG